MRLVAETEREIGQGRGAAMLPDAFQPLAPLVFKKVEASFKCPCGEVLVIEPTFDFGESYVCPGCGVTYDLVNGHGTWNLMKREVR